MNPIRLIEMKEEILSANINLVDEIRDQLREENLFIRSLIASSGAGKTSLVFESGDER